jgi:hypothetical protein
MSGFRTALVLPLLALALFMAVPATASANGGCTGSGCPAKPLTISRAEFVMDLLNEQFLNVTGTVRCDSVGTVEILVNVTDQVTTDTFAGSATPKCVTKGECINWLVTALSATPNAGARPGDLATVDVVTTGATVATLSRNVILQQYS